MTIWQHYTFGVSADKLDIPLTNRCEPGIAWTVIVSAEVKKLLLKLLLIKMHLSFYSLYCIYFKNIITCIHRFLVPITRRNVAESTWCYYKNCNLYTKQFSQHSPKSSQRDSWHLIELLGHSSSLQNRRQLSVYRPDFFDFVGLNLLKFLGLFPFAIFLYPPTPFPSKSEEGTEGWATQTKYCVYCSISQACPLLVVETRRCNSTQRKEVIVSLEQGSALFSCEGPESKYF